MQCNICGKKITSGYKVSLEGSEVLACNNCSKHGKRIRKVYESQKELKKERKEESSMNKNQNTKKKTKEELGFKENFDKLIKQEREKRDMKQQEFAKMLGIKSSLLHQLESGKETNIKIAKKIQNKLGITILERVKVGDHNQYKAKSRARTIGDLIKEKMNEK